MSRCPQKMRVSKVIDWKDNVHETTHGRLATGQIYANRRDSKEHT